MFLIVALVSGGAARLVGVSSAAGVGRGVAPVPRSSSAAVAPKGVASGPVLAAVTDLKGGFVPIAPLRVLDTRNGTGAPVAPIGAGQTVTVQVGGVGGAVPSKGVSAVALEVTVLDPSVGSYLEVWEAGQAQPPVSSVDTTGGVVGDDLVISRVSAGGKVAVYNSAGSTDVTVDVVGWFSDGTVAGGSSFVPVAPVRLFDTRQTHQTLGPGGQVVVRVAGVDGVPSSGVTGVVFTLTAVQPTAASLLRVWPTGSPEPLGPAATAVPALAFSSLVVSAVSASGSVTVASSAGTTDVLGDLAGFFTSGAGVVFHAVAPVRMLDTRNGTGVAQGQIGPGGVDTLQVTGSSSEVPKAAKAVVINVGVVNQTASGYVILGPAGQPPPGTTNVSFGASGAIADLAVVELSSGGALSVDNVVGSVDVFGDVVGYFQ